MSRLPVTLRAGLIAGIATAALAIGAAVVVFGSDDKRPLRR